jgi:hypothetical protein
MKNLVHNLSWDAIWSLPPSEFLSLVILALLVAYAGKLFFQFVVYLFRA